MLIGEAGEPERDFVISGAVDVETAPKLGV